MSFTAIAEQILRDAKALDAYIEANGLPRPSLDADGPAMTPYKAEEVNHSRAELLGNIHKLSYLVQGPFGPWIGGMLGPYGDAVTTAAIYRFKIAEHVPLDGPASFEEVAQKCGLALRDFTMIVRYAMTNFIFAEPSPGMITHTASSKVLAGNPLIQALMGMSVNENFVTLHKELDTLQQYPGSEEPTESGWALAHGAKVAMFEELALRYPERAKGIAFAMNTLSTMLPDSVTLSAFDWASLGPIKVVDVGGGRGDVCRALAKNFPDMTFVVQDLDAVIKAGKEQCPAEVKDRIEYMTHNYFDVQPVKDADVYFFRAIIHDWSNKYAIKVLQNLIPALKKGARVMIIDPQTPDPLKTPLWQDRLARASNLRMKLFFNAHDREDGEWASLFARVDPRFKVKSLKTLQRSPGDANGPTLVAVEAVFDA